MAAARVTKRPNTGSKVQDFVVERRPSKSSSLCALRTDRYSPFGSRPPSRPPSAVTVMPWIPKASQEDQWLARTLPRPTRPSKVPCAIDGNWSRTSPGRSSEPSSPAERAKRLNPSRLQSCGTLGCRPRTPQSIWQQNTLATLGRVPRAQDDFDLPIREVFEFEKRRSVEGKTHSSSSRGPSKQQPQHLERPSPSRGSDLDASQDDPRSARSKGSDVRESQEQGADQTTGVGRKLQKRNSLEDLQMYLPDADRVLARLRGGEQGFSESERNRMKATFNRYRLPDTAEVHKDDLVAILRHLGYVHVEAEQVARIATEITEYATFELNDFESFIESYAKYEVSKYREVFDEFDIDQSGALDNEEIMRFLTHLGYTPLRSTVSEAVSLVDLDGNGLLEFEEVVLLMNLYRHSEGFSRAELDALSRAFSEFERIILPGDSEQALPAEKLALLFTKFFGPAHYENASKLAEELLQRSGPIDTAAEEEENNRKAPAVHFSEALIWARKLRDKEFESYRAAFEKFDTDASGTIDAEELLEVLKSLGYTLSPDIIRAMLQKAHERGQCPREANIDEMDYDAFVHFMQILSETDGFSPAEMATITEVFKRFDADGSEDIDVIELSDVLNFLGYATSLDQVHILLSKVDYGRTGVLGFREFLRFMRLHREFVLAAMKEVHKEFCDEAGMLTEDAARDALVALREKDKVTLLRKRIDEDPVAKRRESIASFHSDIQVVEISGPLNYDQFFALAERLREDRVKELRKRAGFTDVEIGRIRNLFQEYALSNSESLSMDEVTKLLVSLGFPLQTVEQQQDLIQQVKDAIEKAVELGVAEDDGKINLWVLVQLIRGLNRRDDRLTMDKVLRAAQQSRFSPTECAEFREVFTGWCEREKLFEDQQPLQNTAEVAEEECKTITKSSIVRLLRCLGLKVEAPHRALLDNKASELGCGERVDFADFLRLMRWMMDDNFANIGKAAAGIA